MCQKLEKFFNLSSKTYKNKETIQKLLTMTFALNYNNDLLYTTSFFLFFILLLTTGKA